MILEPKVCLLQAVETLCHMSWRNESLCSLLRASFSECAADSQGPWRDSLILCQLSTIVLTIQSSEIEGRLRFDRKLEAIESQY